MRQQTDEVRRLQDFRKIKVVNVPVKGRAAKRTTNPVAFNTSTEERKERPARSSRSPSGRQGSSASPRTNKTA